MSDSYSYNSYNYGGEMVGSHRMVDSDSNYFQTIDFDEESDECQDTYTINEMSLENAAQRYSLSGCDRIMSDSYSYNSYNYGGELVGSHRMVDSDSDSDYFQTIDFDEESDECQDTYKINQMSLENAAHRYSLSDFQTSGFIRPIMNTNVYRTTLSHCSNVSVGESSQGRNVTIDDVMDRLIQIEQKMPSHEACITIAKGNAKLLIKKHRSEGVYAETRALKMAKSKLYGNQLVIIKGNLGDGKTSLGTELLYQFSKDNEFHWKKTPLMVSSTSEWYAIVNNMKNVIVLIEDIFGSKHFEVKKFHKWKDSLDNIYAATKHLPIYVIVTVSNHIFREHRSQLGRHELFGKENVIDLGCEALRLTADEKKNILKNHLQKRHREFESLNLHEIACLEFHFGFPQCCHIFAENDHCFNQKEEFFRNPIEYLCRQLDLYKEDDHDIFKYLVLVSILTFGGLDQNITKKFRKSKKLKRINELSTNCAVARYSFTKFSDALLSIQDSFVIYNEKTSKYEFTNNIIREAVCIVYGRVFPKHVLGILSLNTLCKYVKVKACNHACICLHITREYYPLLIKRLLREIRQGGTRDIAGHIAWKQPPFYSVLFQTLKGREILKLYGSKVSRDYPGFLYWVLYQQGDNVQFFDSLLECMYSQLQSFTCFRSSKVFIQEELYRCLKLAFKDQNRPIYETLLNEYGVLIGQDIIEMCESEDILEIQQYRSFFKNTVKLHSVVSDQTSDTHF